MTLNARRDGQRVTVGKWTSDSEGLETFTRLEMAEMWGGTLYSFIGFELHSVQQGQSELTYNRMKVSAASMEDTGGEPVQNTTIIKLDDDTFTVGELDENELINWGV